MRYIRLDDLSATTTKHKKVDRTQVSANRNSWGVSSHDFLRRVLEVKDEVYKIG